MADKRKGFKFVTELAGSEQFVSMIEFDGDVFVCTNKSMYKLVDECLMNMEIEMEDDVISEVYDEQPTLQIDGYRVNHLCGRLIRRVVVVGDKLVNIIMDYDNE